MVYVLCTIKLGLKESTPVRRNREFPFNGNVYRSEYERVQAKRLVEEGINFEYESTQIDFYEETNQGVCADCGSKNVIKNRKYTPDFHLTDTNIFVETKGKFDASSRTKMRNVINQSEHDVRMVFMRNNYLTRKHKMTYGRWCDLNDIKWAVGDIPLEWARWTK